MHIDNDRMETGSLIFMGNGWYKDKNTEQMVFMTEEGEFITQAEFNERMDEVPDAEDYDR